MAVPAHEWKRVLTAECSNPNVIRRNGLSKMPKLRVDIRIVVCSSLRHLKHGAIANETVQPARIAHPMAGRAKFFQELGVAGVAAYGQVDGMNVSLFQFEEGQSN